MSKTLRSLLIAGATGLVGRAALREVLADTTVREVHAVARKPTPGLADDPRLHWMRVDFAALPALPAAQAALCALGTTIRVAGSQDAFRAVDHDAVLAFARAALAAGVRRFALVSALGADASSAVFYNRVKGEAEDAIAALGFESLVIARPSLLLGNRGALGQPLRTGERIAQELARPFAACIPLRWRPIDARVVARALWRGLRAGAPGTRVLGSDELHGTGST